MDLSDIKIKSSELMEYLKIASWNVAVWAANASAWITVDFALKIIAAVLGIALTIYSLRFVIVRTKSTKELTSLEKKKLLLSIKQKQLELKNTQAISIKQTNTLE